MSKAVDQSTIGIVDLKKMMKTKMPDNPTEYDRSSIEYTNKLIDDFFRDVIIPTAIDDKINAVWAVGAWEVYQEGKEIEITWELRDELYNVPAEQLEYWKTVFELPVNEMLKLGRSTLLFGYDILNLWYRRWVMETKYQSFFSKPDPSEWIRKREDIKAFEGDPSLSPIDIVKYTEKIRCIMRHVKNYKL